MMVDETGSWMQLDLLAAVVFGATFVVCVLVVSGSFSRRPLTRRWLAGILIAWFGVTSFVAVPPVGPVPGTLFVIAIPVATAWLLMARNPTMVTRLDHTAVAGLVAIQISRLAGGGFVVLYEQGRLSAPFAIVAGWGDVITALIAIPVAVLALRQHRHWRRWVLIWNIIGTADFLLAIFLGSTSTAGSALQLFSGGPGVAIIGELPWRYIPAFYVPLFLSVHLAIFIWLASRAKRTQSLDTSGVLHRASRH